MLVQLTGGNDGLSMIVPHGDDAYHNARKATRIDARDVLRIDGYRGFHPKLARLRAVFDSGRLAIVEGVGYENPIRSHFKSFDIWHAADTRGRNAGEGWIGRLCQASFGNQFEPNRVVHIGGSVPYSLYSTRHPAISFVVPEGYRWVGQTTDDSHGAKPRKPKKKPNAALAYLRGVESDAKRSSAAVRAAAARYRPNVAYPRDAFGDSLRAAAALIDANMGTRVISVSLGTFDTHNAQRSRHDRLMDTLDRGLASFLADLGHSERGRNTIVMAFSEFGRRVAENGSAGTDHGCAGPMFVAGPSIKGGLFGKHPSLTELDDGDLVHTTDFRSVYATVIEACFEIDSARVLGAKYPRLDLI